VKFYITMCDMYVPVGLYVAACLAGLSTKPHKEPSPLPIFIHADDVVRRRRFASWESVQSFWSLFHCHDYLWHRTKFCDRYLSFICMFVLKTTQKLADGFGQIGLVDRDFGPIRKK